MFEKSNPLKFALSLLGDEHLQVKDAAYRDIGRGERLLSITLKPVRKERLEVRPMQTTLEGTEVEDVPQPDELEIKHLKTTAEKVWYVIDNHPLTRKNNTLLVLVFLKTFHPDVIKMRMTEQKISEVAQIETILRAKRRLLTTRK